MKKLILFAIAIIFSSIATHAGQLKSTPVSVVVRNATNPGNSDLAKLAAGLAKGQWADFTMGGMNSSLFSANGPSVPSIITYAGRALWDPVHKKIQFAGTSHTGGLFVQGAGALVTWDDSTNQWRKESYNWSSEDPGHEYYHLTLNKSNGDLYFRGFNSAKIYRRQYGETGQASWKSGIVANHPNESRQVAGALEWFPELNSGKGGLVFADALGAAKSNDTLTSWTQQAGTASSGNYDQFSAHAGGLVYFGGGIGSTAMYKMNSQGAVSAAPSLPIPAGPNDMSALVLTHPNGTDLLIFQVRSGGDIYQFNGTAWNRAGTHLINADGFWVGVTIPEYGVIVFLAHPGGTGSPFARVFKPN